MAITDNDYMYAATKQEWRTWLAENHREKQGVWLVQYKKSTGKPTLTWSEAVDEALCFGWIDSIKKKLDEERTVQFFSKRKPTSTWSKINKEKVNRLIEDGLMTPAGLDCIETAKRNGSWTILDEVEALKIPEDLAAAFELYDGAKDYFEHLSKSSRKLLLQKLILAKRPETRKKRIDEIIALTSRNETLLEFTAKLEIIGINPFVAVPKDILDSLLSQAGKDRGPIPIKGTINGIRFQQTLVRYSGAWRLYVNTAMLRNSPNRIGEEVRLTVAFDTANRAITPHPRLIEALAQNGNAKAAFDALAPSMQKEIIRYISFLKTEASIERNVAKAIDFLLGNGPFIGRKMNQQKHVNR